ncbi:HAD-like protein [Cylindrobasidium torrendii FP15055 ss-10]|uniref:HAD-like protein n=1 Tax=Cylindrobasidium torrendii FP15055 ss-10 TaxID=1314674 RepID=A0A0D7B797_9AGAR|nr:HAD-like protein [Cylindrobasidium torrendii FP15055 ss-10]
MSSPGLKAVIFDIGGVVVRSPFVAIADYERKRGLPENYLNIAIVARGHSGAWQKFERGELPLLSFYGAFSSDLSDTVNNNTWYTDYCRKRGVDCPPLPRKVEIDGRELFGAMMRLAGEYDPHILKAIQRIRAAGKHKILALTNNYANVSPEGEIPKAELDFLGWGEEGAVPTQLRALFDDFCDSSALGMRKPEPEFYLLACKRNDIKPSEAVFLDDIRMNLKAAKELGMDTIHVPIGGSLDAVRELERKIGIDLTGESEDKRVSKL